MPHLEILEFEWDIVAGWDFGLLPLRKVRVFYEGKKIKKKNKNVYLDLKGGPFLRLVVIYLKMSSSWVNRLQFPDSLAAT